MALNADLHTRSGLLSLAVKHYESALEIPVRRALCVFSTEPMLTLRATGRRFQQRSCLQSVDNLRDNRCSRPCQGSLSSLAIGVMGLPDLPRPGP